MKGRCEVREKMLKNNYERPRIDLIYLDSCDVIATSVIGTGSAEDEGGWATNPL